VFLVNSRLGLVSAASSSSVREGPHPTEAPLLPKLRGQFAEFLNQGYLDRLGILYLSTCVGLGYGRLTHSLEAFLGSMGSVASPSAARYHASGLMTPRICLGDPPTRLPQDDHRLGPPTLLRPPFAGLLPAGSVALPKEGSLSTLDSALARVKRYRNINLSSIAYACRPRLRARLTLGG
jgi:hypothetical protein